MRSLFSKKGQVNTLGTTMLALIFAAIILVFGLIITQELREVPIISQSVSTTTNNETGGYINETGYTLAQSGLGGFAKPAIISISNNTIEIVVLAGNYTLTGNVITNATPEVFSNVNISYSFVQGGEAYSAANETIVGLGTFADFWDIIVLAIVLTIVIGLLLITFGRQGRR